MKKYQLTLLFTLFLSFSSFSQNEGKFIKKGRKYAFKKNYPEAIIQFSSALDINPKNINTLIYKSLVHEQIKEYSTAIELLNKIINLGYKPPSIYLRRATCYYNSKQDSNALLDLNKFLTLEPNSFDGLYQRGAVYFIQKKYPLAIKDFTKMLHNSLKQNISPKGLNYIYLGRAWAFLKYEKYNKALEDIHVVLRVDSNQYEALECRATVNLKLKNNQAALKDINRSLEIKPDNVSTLLTKSEILYEMNDYLNMCVYYNKAIDLGFKPSKDEFSEVKSKCENLKK